MTTRQRNNDTTIKNSEYKLKYQLSVICFCSFVQVLKTNILLKITLQELRNMYFTDHADFKGILVILQVFTSGINKQTKNNSTTAVDRPTAYTSKGYNSITMRVCAISCNGNDKHLSLIHNPTKLQLNQSNHYGYKVLDRHTACMCKTRGP